MFARYASAVSSGTLMTFALLYVMQLLISLQPGAQVEVPEHFPIDFIMATIIEPPVRTRELIVTKEKLTNTEIQPPRPDFEGGSETIHVSRPVASTGTGPIGFGGMSDGTLVNLVRVSPIYPARALAQGIEGYVIVQFDVDVNGKVTNVVVVESSHSVFEREARKAAQRFKFKPRVVDGVALMSTGVQNLFRFELDEQ